MGQEISVDSEKLTKKQIALNTAGATRELAYKTYVEAATSAVIVKYDRDGECLGEQIDYATRIKAADSISRLNGDMKDEVAIGGTVIINIGSGAIEQLLHMVKDVSEQLRALKVDGRQTGEIIDVTST